MAIVNRDLDASQKNKVYSGSWTSVVTGKTLLVGPIASAGAVQAIECVAAGVSGTPTYAFTINRFIVGTGVTVITGGATTLSMATVGTSGPTAFVLASGSSLLAVLPNDVVQITSGGANTASDLLAIAIVVSETQDIVTKFGV